VSASVTATSANIEGAITPNGSAITAASFCYGTSSTLASCTSAPLASSAYSGLAAASTNDPVYVSVSGLTPGTTYYYSLQATNANGSGTSSTPYGSFTTAAAGAFSCTPSFYQISGYSSGGLYNYDVSGNSFTRIGSGSVAGINGLGYDTANNYLYAVAGSTLYQINNDGQYTSLGAVSGLTQSTGGDFYDGQLLETGGSGLNFESVNVTSKTESAFTLTDHAVGSIPGASSWAASDITIQGNYAYGLSTSSSGTTLYVANLANRYLASIPVTGIPSTTSGTYAYGAAYSDAGGNAYFYNNTTNIMYEISSSALQAAIANDTDPVGTAIGSGASSPGLSSPNDGATCPNAASPYAPSVNPPSAVAVGVTTAGVSGVVSPSGATLSAVNFCYSTGADVATVGGALSDSPTCDPVDQTTYPFTTWTGANLYNVGVLLSGLSGCTTYYYQSEAVNGDGTAYSSVASFTTGGCQTVSFSSSATNAIAGGGYTPTGSATSGLTPVITVDPSATGVCGISAGVVSFDASGSCVVDINQAGNGSYAPAPQVQQTIVVSTAPQTVQFTSIAPTSATVSDAYTPTGTASSGLTPVITVDPSAAGVCSITSGLLTFATTGSCVLDINQNGNSAYAPAPQIQQTITVSTESQTVQFTSPAPTNATVGDTYTPTGSASSSLTPALTVDPSSNGLCSMSGGVVTFNATGSCVLDINQAGNGSYAPASQVQQAITVAGDQQSVQFTSNAPTAATVGDTYAPTGSATSGLTPVITVDSSSTGVCSISAGVVTFNAAGSCVLDINQAGTSSYDPAAQFQQTINVAAAPQSSPSSGSPSSGSPSQSTPSKGTSSNGSSSTTTNFSTVAAPSITSVTVGNGQAVVSWNPSATHNAKVLGYVVSTAGGSITCKTGTTSCLVTGLTNGRTYTFTVTAITTAGKVKSTRTSKGVKPSAAPTVPAKGSIQALRDTGRVVSASGRVTRVAFTEHGSEISVGNKSFGLSLQVAAGSVHYAHSVVSVVSGTKAKISGYGFLPGSTVTLYVASDRTELGTARVRGNGNYEGIYKIPSSLKNGYHTVVSAGIVSNRTRKSVEGSVHIISKQLLDVVPFEFNESTLTPRLAAIINSDASTIALGGFTHVTVTAYTDPRGTSGYNIGLSQRRAGTVAATLKADLSALGTHNVTMTIIALGKSDPVASNGHVIYPASRRATIAI
jgi:outer membrane protein OmpA-like peptidoglycan-associated protein